MIYGGCTLYNVYNVYSLHCTMYNLQCTVYNVKCTMAGSGDCVIQCVWQQDGHHENIKWI